MNKFWRIAPLALAIGGVQLTAEAGEHKYSLGLLDVHNKHTEYTDHHKYHPLSGRYFQRVSVFPICENLPNGCDDDTETVAEIVMPSNDGKTLVYTDSPSEQLGFVDISNPSAPVGLGNIKLNGEPTSVAVSGHYALVGVNTSAGDIISGSEDASAGLTFTRDMSGELAVYDMRTGELLQTLDLGGSQTP